MEAAGATSSRLARSASLLHHHRSRTARLPPSPQAQLTPLSAAAASPRALPLRRTRSDAELAYSARSAVVLRRHAPIPAILEADDEEEPRHLQDGAGGGGRNGGGGRGGGGGGGQGQGQGSGCDMGEYYRRVLRVDPGNPLLLRKYLHEVERDLAGAEACYARALLACPGDADLLSLYGRVIWEARQEKDRAADYFERAVQAAPDDCYVLGSYASFLWDAEDDEEEDASTRAADVKEETTSTAVASCDSPALAAC